MNKASRLFGRTIINSFFLAVLLAVLAIPAGFSLIFLASKEAPFSAFQLTPSADNYEGYLTFGKVAGGQAEEIMIDYTAFPDFEAFYDGVFVVENTQKTKQTFVIKKPQGQDVRLFFGKIGAADGPGEISLGPGEKAVINLAAQPISGAKPTTLTLTFTLQSFPEK